MFAKVSEMGSITFTVGRLLGFFFLLMSPLCIEVGRSVKEALMARIDQASLKAVLNDYEQYVNDVENSGLSEKSKSTYMIHAEHFIRWLEDHFEPGMNVRHRSRKWTRRG